MIQPTTRFGQMRAQRSLIFEVLDKEDVPPGLKFAAKIPSQELDVGSCNQTITPECLRALYKVGNVTADRESKAILGVGGFLEVSRVLAHTIWRFLINISNTPNMMVWTIS